MDLLESAWKWQLWSAGSQPWGVESSNFQDLQSRTSRTSHKKISAIGQTFVSMSAPWSNGTWMHLYLGCQLTFSYACFTVLKRITRRCHCVILESLALFGDMLGSDIEKTLPELGTRFFRWLIGWAIMVGTLFFRHTLLSVYTLLKCNLNRIHVISNENDGISGCHTSHSSFYVVL